MEVMVVYVWQRWYYCMTVYVYMVVEVYHDAT